MSCLHFSPRGSTDEVLFKLFFLCISKILRLKVWNSFSVLPLPLFQNVSQIFYRVVVLKYKNVVWVDLFAWCRWRTWLLSQIFSFPVWGSWFVGLIQVVTFLLATLLHPGMWVPSCHLHQLNVSPVGCIHHLSTWQQRMCDGIFLFSVGESKHFAFAQCPCSFLDESSPLSLNEFCDFC